MLTLFGHSWFGLEISLLHTLSVLIEYPPHSFNMRLRRTITIPTRYEDEDPLPPRSRNGTRPAYPSLLRDQVIPFNPDHPPAQFPSLPLSTPCPSAHKLQSDIDSTAESPTSLDDFPMESPNRHCNIHILPTRQLSSTDGDPVQNPSTNLLRGSSRTPDDLITCSSHTSAHAIPANLQEPVATLVLKERVSRRDADLSPALNASAIADGNMLSITYRNVGLHFSIVFAGLTLYRKMRQYGMLFQCPYNTRSLVL